MTLTKLRWSRSAASLISSNGPDEPARPTLLITSPTVMSGGARLVEPPVVVITSPTSIGPTAWFSVTYCIAGSLPMPRPWHAPVSRTISGGSAVVVGATVVDVSGGTSVVPVDDVSASASSGPVVVVVSGTVVVVEGRSLTSTPLGVVPSVVELGSPAADGSTAEPDW